MHKKGHLIWLLARRRSVWYGYLSLRDKPLFYVKELLVGDHALYRWVETTTPLPEGRAHPEENYLGGGTKEEMTELAEQFIPELHLLAKVGKESLDVT